LGFAAQIFGGRCAHGAGTGGNSPARNVEIKVGITPTNGQVGNIPPITGPITVTGKDTFTNADITINRQAITTQLFNDVSMVGANGLVVQ
jgi:acyl dehydratase